MGAEPEIRFDDGNISGAVRVGNTVRRATGPWTPAVHALLRHLEQAGFDGAPRVLGFDERGREVLSFIAGVTIPPSLASFWADTLLVEVAHLLRRYHDATAGFVAPPGAAWRVLVGAPTAGEVVCHNDIAPWNTVVVDGRPTAFIDWDFAAPAPRAWDIAHALWRYVPLYPDPAFGRPTDHARRLAVFCDAYGLADRRGLLDTVERRLKASYDTLAAWAAAGDPAFVALWRDGHADGSVDDIAYLRRHRAEFERHLNA